MAKIEDMKSATDDQLSTQLSDLKREQFNLRFQAATNQLEKPSPDDRADQDPADRA